MTERAPITHYAVPGAYSHKFNTLGSGVLECLTTVETEGVASKEERRRAADAMLLGSVACSEHLRRKEDSLSLAHGSVIGLTGEEIVVEELGSALRDPDFARQYLEDLEHFKELQALSTKDLLDRIPKWAQNIAVERGADLLHSTADGGLKGALDNDSEARNLISFNDDPAEEPSNDWIVAMLSILTERSPEVVPGKRVPLRLVQIGLKNNPTTIDMEEERAILKQITEEVSGCLAECRGGVDMDYLPEGFAKKDIEGVDPKFNPRKRKARKPDMVEASTVHFIEALSSPRKNILNRIMPNGINVAEAITYVDINSNVRRAIVVEVGRILDSMADQGELDTLDRVKDNIHGKIISHNDALFEKGRPREVVAAMVLDMLSGHFDWQSRAKLSMAMAGEKNTISGEQNGDQHSTAASIVLAKLKKDLD